MVSNDKYSEYSRKRLANNLHKKFQTVTIGALAAFEDGFGHLWGHGKPVDELTEEELEYRRVWETTRTRILDLGNSNARGAKSEIAQYNVTWNRYITKFEVLGGN